MRHLSYFLFLAIAISVSCTEETGKKAELKTYCNPLDLEYRYQFGDPSYREAADPTVVMFRDIYFLFASKTGGYWYSADLHDWKLVETDMLPVEDYAPAAIPIGDTLYFAASSGEAMPFYKSVDPVSGEWEVACDTFNWPVWDPAFFMDDDERLYLYWGCSNENPLYGIELDYRNGFRPIGEITVCFNSDQINHGWERPGDINELSRRPWIEGPWMNKFNGKYYLQYAAPGTEFNSYADGVYVSDHPLGLFHYQEHNPFSLKVGGFSNGAGHGNTFADRYGNLWHTATIAISNYHLFERRLAIFPAEIDKEGILYATTVFGDYPYYIPGKKVESIDDLYTGLNLLSYGKSVSSSPGIDSLSLSNIVDENIQTFWAANTGNHGEWVILDLGEIMNVQAIQVNFYDFRTEIKGRLKGSSYQFTIEGSSDQDDWFMISDMSSNEKDSPHFYRYLDEPVKTRFIKLTNVHFPSGNFCISDLRIFGKGNGERPNPPGKVFIKSGGDPTEYIISWEKSNEATGYNLRYGIAEEKLYHSRLVYSDTSVLLTGLNSGSEYFLKVDAFNENGVSGDGVMVSFGK